MSTIEEELNTIKKLSSQLEQIDENAKFEEYCTILEEFINIYSTYGENSRVSLPFSAYDDISENLKEKSTFFISKENIVKLQHHKDISKTITQGIIQAMVGDYLDQIMPQLSQTDRPSPENLSEGIWFAEQVNNEGIKQYLLEKLIRLYPTYHHRLLELLDVLINNNRFEDAHKLLQENTSITDDFLLREAIIMARLGKIKQAFQKLELIKQPSLEYISTLLEIGQKALLIDPKKELLVFFKKALITYPNNHYLQFLLGEEHYISGRFKEAEKLFTAIKKTLPKPNHSPQLRKLNTKIAQRLIEIYQRLNRKPEATETLLESTIKDGVKWENIPYFSYLTNSSQLNSELINEVEGVYFDESRDEYIVTSNVGLVFLILSNLNTNIRRLKITHSSVDLRDTVSLFCKYDWPVLQDLHVHCEALDDLTLLELVNTKFYHQIVKFTLVGGKLSYFILQELFVTLPHKLEELAIKQLQLPKKSNSKTSFLQPLLNNFIVKNLFSLTFDTCGLNANDLNQLSLLSFNRLSLLSFRGNDLTGYETQKLKNVQWFKNLKELDISYTSIERDFLHFLKGATIENKLEKIHLQGDWSLTDYLPHINDERFFWGEIKLQD